MPPPESNGRFEMSAKISENSGPPESSGPFENSAFPRDTMNTVRYSLYHAVVSLTNALRLWAIFFRNIFAMVTYQACL